MCYLSISRMWVSRIMGRELLRSEIEQIRHDIYCSQNIKSANKLKVTT